MPIQLTVKAVGADIVRQGLERLDTEIPRIGRKRIYEVMKRIRRKLAARVRRPTYPIDWDSDRQRRYVMALLRRKGNIPYKPTGRYERNWHIEKREHGYSIENRAAFARYASGDFRGQGQSHIHEGRRLLMAEVVENEIKELPQEIEEYITYYGRGLNLIP